MKILKLNFENENLEGDCWKLLIFLKMIILKLIAENNNLWKVISENDNLKGDHGNLEGDCGEWVEL